MLLDVSCACRLPIFSASVRYGWMRASTSAATDGMFTAARAGLPCSTSAICSAMSMATLTCASSVLAPRCGVVMMLGMPSRGLSSGAGSVEKTSMAAPPILPALAASASAASSMMPPRATLISRTVGFISASFSALIMPAVSLVLGTWTVM